MTPDLGIEPCTMSSGRFQLKEADEIQKNQIGMISSLQAFSDFASAIRRHQNIGPGQSSRSVALTKRITVLGTRMSFLITQSAVRQDHDD